MELPTPDSGLFFATLFFYFVIAGVIIYCLRIGKLTFPAAIAALLIGVFIAVGDGAKGVFLLFTFFVLGVWATSHRKDLKAKISTEGDHPQGRTAGQVFANGGVAAIVALLSLFAPGPAHLYQLMLAASLASALADTLSSELGMVYGRNFFNILSFKKEPKGLDGVISLEGTLIGAAGAAIISLIYDGFSQLSLIVLIAGVLGNLADSLLGAAFERKHLIGNNTVNFLNTLFAALVAALLYGCILYAG
ncbi:DUF92 domain-containing protein [Chitinophaga pinensis]|uniref:DUF92 domain-containing protein n=1 Tax=Chitinophaga pinensis (strain ATCC 43595 / DSM 2588 / LMG 13176 / NBRC 15968 / NCIMB 11800 / UQM 2034) TaxID=485918 RepID=A0A979G7M0_CHIPD|nr:DUF92 domain-containing protein [Chitinophaga pinensis]ACU62123.1 protein of unknown function DUF92 transmembrane [Chitinophaga pinensis DSM 2588]